MIKKKKKVKSNSKSHKNLLFAIVILSITLFIGIVSGWLGYEIGTNSKKIDKDLHKELLQARQEISSLQKKLSRLDSQTIKQKKVVVNFLTESGDCEKSSKIDIPAPPPPKKIKDNRPILAIIIDDVAYENQLKLIKNLPFPVTPSIFPPTKKFLATPRLAKNLKHYMIHFPLQAQSYPKYALPNTLTIDSSLADIEKRVANIKRWFPNAIYTNNHTGSKFTQNLRSMNMLMRILKKYNMIFIDSRTTPKTIVSMVVKKYNQPYFRRDIFLDNIRNEKYILKQLKKAISKAKKQGSALAIGHPHHITLQTLKKYKDLLKDLNVVYIDEYVKHFSL